MNHSLLVGGSRSRLLLFPLVLFVFASCAGPLNYTRPDGPRFTGCRGNTHVTWSPRTGGLRGGTEAWPVAPRAAGIHVASFNIQFSKRIEEAAALIHETPVLSQADVLLLQEMDERGVRRLASEFGYCWVYYPATVHPRTKRRFGNAILSRHPFLDDHKVLLPHLGQFGKTLRIAVGATLDVNGTAVRVYSLHLATLMELGPERRRDQARAVVEDAAGFRGPVLVGGDFNEHGLGEVFVENGYDWYSKGLGKTTEFAGLDHFLTRGLELAPGASVGKVSDNRGASDHLPIWARFDLPGVSSKACDCGPTPGPAGALEAADAVFQGSVIATRFSESRPDTTEATSPGSGFTRYEILVENIWKGDVPDTVAVYSETGEAGCGFPFFLGNDFLVYANVSGTPREPERWPPGTKFPLLVTDRCTRTRHMSRAAPDLDELPPPERRVLERERILIRKLQGRDTRSLETAPGGETEMALYGFLHGWLESPPHPLPFSPGYLPTLEGVVALLERNILAAGSSKDAEDRLALARSASADAIGLEAPIRIVDVTDAWEGGSGLVVLEDGGGKRLTVIKRAGIPGGDR